MVPLRVQWNKGPAGQRSRAVAQIGSLSALAIGFGYLLSPVPNVELITITCFLSGLFLGWGKGMAIGFLSMTVYSLLNPRGMALPLVTASQALGMALAGLWGDCVSPFVGERVGKRVAVLFAVNGLLVTAVYDFLTNAAFGLSIGTLWPAIVAGVGFSVIHMVSNVFVFALVGVSLLRVTEKAQMWRREAR